MNDLRKNLNRIGGVVKTDKANRFKVQVISFERALGLTVLRKQLLYGKLHYLKFKGAYRPCLALKTETKTFVVYLDEIEGFKPYLEKYFKTFFPFL